MLNHKVRAVKYGTIAEYRMGNYVERLLLVNSQLVLEWHNTRYSCFSRRTPTTTRQALRWMAGNEAVKDEFGLEKISESRPFSAFCNRLAGMV